MLAENTNPDCPDEFRAFPLAPEPTLEGLINAEPNSYYKGNLLLVHSMHLAGADQELFMLLRDLASEVLKKKLGSGGSERDKAEVSELPKCKNCGKPVQKEEGVICHACYSSLTTSQLADLDA